MFLIKKNNVLIKAEFGAVTIRKMSTGPMAISRNGDLGVHCWMLHKDP